MSKIYQAREKRIRNEAYAEKYRKTSAKKRRQTRFANWCRVKGHEASCQCTLPTPEEVRGGRR